MKFMEYKRYYILGGKIIMTENEAIKILKKPEEYIRIYDGDFVFPSDFAKAYETAIKALEEIQRYRALEEKLNGISVEQVVNGFISTVEKQTHEEYKRGRILTNKEAEELKAYRAIGTIEEFKALKEKSVAKKVVYVSNIGIKTPHCPNCNIELTMSMHLKKFCNCGQALDWQ